MEREIEMDAELLTARNKFQVVVAHQVSQLRSLKFRAVLALYPPSHSTESPALDPQAGF